MKPLVTVAKEDGISYEEWLEWRKEYYEMKDIGEHNNLGVSVEGDLRKSTRGVTSPAGRKGKKGQSSRPKKITKKKLKEGTVNNALRTTKAEYLRYHTKTVAVINAQGEYEIKPTKNCGEGDVVWVLEDDNTFTKTKIV